MSSVTLSFVLPNSSSSLGEIYSALNNPIACANYGGGVHCNQEKINLKLNIWGNANLQRNETDCMGARIAEENEESIALFNIGKTGNPATVKDVIKGGEVYEFSGLMAADKLFASNVNCNKEANLSYPFIQDTASGCYFEKNIDGLKSVANQFHSLLNFCTHNTAYTGAFVTFTPSHPYQQDFMAQAGARKLTPANIESLLGLNSLHPERFRFEGEQLQECTKWDKNSDQVSHYGWHNSHPCIAWADKTAMVLGVDQEAGFKGIEF